MKTQNGFTLIELMIAVALVAILTMISVPAYQGYSERAARANVQADLVSAAAAMERRKAQNFTYAGATAGTATTDTFSSLSPNDAVAGKEKYNLSLILLTAGGSVAAPGSVVARYEILAVSGSNFATGKSEALKIDSEGRKCYKPLGASVTSCTVGTDPTWK
ncbi:MAG: putative secretion protein [Moraxellaceae bacterium]|jgi:type IV pilus assembly protein PilE|nr:putative secretion protein [Moraxellaceae bacterium]